MAVQITYDGKTTTVADGKTATMACGGKLMKTDVVVAAEAVVAAPYVIPAGTYKAGDVQLVEFEQDIRFTSNGTDYTGMWMNYYPESQGTAENPDSEEITPAVWVLTYAYGSGGSGANVHRYTPSNGYATWTSEADMTIIVPEQQEVSAAYFDWFTKSFSAAGGSGGGSVDGGYTVTFMSEGVQYAVSSVTAGQVISQPTVPRPEGKYFSGWYTDATAGTKIEFPYAPTGDITLYAHFSEQVVVGVTGLTNENGTLTLTDNIAGLEGYTESQDGAYVNVSSPLSEYWPFNEIAEFTDESGNVFVKFPKLWMKWEVNASGYITGYKFSNGQADADYFIPDAFLDPTYITENIYLPYFALGKYEMSGAKSKGYSKSGATCLTTITRAEARSAARAYGNASNLYNGYQQLDFAQYVLYNLLCMMFYQRSNIQKVYGGRTGSGTVTSWSGASVTGTCDGLAGMNGWNTSTDCVKMLGIENPYGNIYKWVDGVYFSGASIYAHRYPQQFADSTSNGTALGFSRPTTSAYIKSFKKGTAVKTQSYMYCAETSGSASQYCGDYCYYGKDGVVLNVGGYWGDPSGAGLWYLGGNVAASASYSSVGARLSFRPL